MLWSIGSACLNLRRNSPHINSFATNRSRAEPCPIAQNHQCPSRHEPCHTPAIAFPEDCPMASAGLRLHGETCHVLIHEDGPLASALLDGWLRARQKPVRHCLLRRARRVGRCSAGPGRKPTLRMLAHGAAQLMIMIHPTSPHPCAPLSAVPPSRKNHQGCGTRPGTCFLALSSGIGSMTGYPSHTRRTSTRRARVRLYPS